MLALEILLLLSLVQGVTEFLPVSSSAHLFLLTHWNGTAHNPSLDVMAHGGTLLAVLIYLRRDIKKIFHAIKAIVTRKSHHDYGDHGDHGDSRFLWLLTIATLPALLVGGAVHSLNLWQAMRSLEVIMVANIVFALLLYGADRFSMTVQKIKHLSPLAALTMGVAQCFAFIPGASRAGVIITAARLMGFERTAATHISLLMSIPIIMGAVILHYPQAPLHDLDGEALIIFGASFLSALLAIHVMMAWVQQSSFTIFVLYRLCLAGFLWIMMA